VSFLPTADAPPWQVDDVLEVDIRVHDTSAYKGRARVARDERVYGQRRVGLQLLTGFLDLHEMQRLDEEQALSQDLLDGPERLLSRIPAALPRRAARRGPLRRLLPPHARLPRAAPP
jgi:hypothetical protein